MIDQDLVSELLYAGMGLHANSSNGRFNPKVDRVAMWANLMLRARTEILRLEGVVRTAEAMASENMAKAITAARQPVSEPDAQ